MGLSDISDANACRFGAMSILWFSDTMRFNTDMASISVKVLLKPP